MDFVYTIIYYFTYQVVKPTNTGAPYIHTGALAHRLQSLQYLDLGFIIIASVSFVDYSPSYPPCSNSFFEKKICSV